MYHAIVRHRILNLFDAINSGNAEPVLAAFSPDAEHIFIGDERALAGRRNNPASIRRWYERLFALIPALHFAAQRIDVSGMPWRTVAIVEWSEKATPSDGTKRASSGVHVVYISWGRITRLLILTDTAKLTHMLIRTADSSLRLSLAEPIDDRSGWPA